MSHDYICMFRHSRHWKKTARHVSQNTWFSWMVWLFPFFSTTVWESKTVLFHITAFQSSSLHFYIFPTLKKFDLCFLGWYKRKRKWNAKKDISCRFIRPWKTWLFASKNGDSKYMIFVLHCWTMSEPLPTVESSDRGCLALHEPRIKLLCPCLYQNSETGGTL